MLSLSKYGGLASMRALGRAQGDRPFLDYKNHVIASDSVAISSPAY